ncbi:MAG: atpC [Candidatus Saccharibacteria bacterium]|nr:atpC [Candidatus Saccharibacteria bacterium]
MSDAPADAKTVDQLHEIIDDTGGAESKLDKEKDAAAIDYENKHKNSQQSMEVRIRSPFRSYYDGIAFSISGENATGPFDILPRHHNFISLLNACELVVRSPKGDEKIQIGGGLMHVKADQVLVFLDV